MGRIIDSALNRFQGMKGHPWMIRAKEFLDRKRNGCRWILAALFSCQALFILQGAEAVPVVNWMNIYRLRDIPELLSIKDFILNLQVPIPPAIALLEIGSYQLTGYAKLITVGLYRAALILPYLLILFMVRPNVLRLTLTYVTSLIFLIATRIIHPGNPQLYDVLLPAFVVCFLFTLKMLTTDPQPSGRTAALVVLSGLALSLAELTRPFMLLLLPFLLAGALLRIRRLPGTYNILFLLPLLVLSGTWHTLQMVRHEQLVWSNHQGFNLLRAWPMIERPELEAEIHNQPLSRPRWPNINTDEHRRNSRRLRAAVLDYVLNHPGESLQRITKRALEFINGPVWIVAHRPDHPIFTPYKGLTNISSTFILINSALLGIFFLERGLGGVNLLHHPLNLALLFMVSTMFIFVIGENSGEGSEQARFMISLLPFLALYPTAQTDLERVPVERRARSGALILVFSAMLLLLATGFDLLRSGSLNIGYRQLGTFIGGFFVAQQGMLRRTQRG